MNLDRVASAQGDVRPPCAGQVYKVLVVAHAATRPPSWRYLGALVPPNIEGEQASPQSILSTHKQLHSFGRCDRCHQIGHRIQNACRLAGFKCAAWQIREYACQAGCLTRKNIQGRAVASYGRYVDPGQGTLHCKIIDQVPRLEVIGSIEDQLRLLQQILNVLRHKIGDLWLNYNPGIERCNFSRRRNCFGCCLRK